MSDLEEFSQRLAVIESMVSKITRRVIGWDDVETPPSIIPKISPAFNQKINRSMVINALQLTAQAKLTKDAKQSETLMRLADDLIAGCGNVPHKHPPFENILAELGHLTETFSEKSLLREAAFNLVGRLTDTARNLNKSVEAEPR